MALKFDLNKAYDIIDCGNLRGMSLKLGFCDKWGGLDHALCGDS